jgi:nucleoside-diphosphate kinase
METTLSIIKPNGVAGGLIGEVISRYEKARLSVVALKVKKITAQECQGFYAEHVGKGFFAELEGFMTSGPVVLLALRGEDAVTKVRAINGATNPKEAAPGTIRSDYASSIGENVVHSSDSPESAAREVSFWFNESEIAEYTPNDSRLG